MNEKSILQKIESGIHSAPGRMGRAGMVATGIMLVLGEFVMPTPSHWLAFAGLLLLLNVLLSFTKLDRGARLLLFLALLYYLYWLRFFPNLKYTNDLAGHLKYLAAVTEDWRNAFLYRGRERWHPPAYYLLHGSVLIHLKPAAVSVAGFYRFLSLPLFFIYLYYAFRTVQLSLLFRGASYYTALGLIAFWPLAIQMATRINNDIALYAISSVTFFSVVKWWRGNPGSAPFWPLVFIGIALTVKSNAIVLIALLLLLLFVRIFRGQLAGFSLFRPKALLGVLMLALGVAINVAKMVLARLGYLSEVYMGKHFGGAGTEQLTIEHFLTFDPIGFLQSPFIPWRSGASFFDFFLRTMLYGEFTFQHRALASVLNGVFLLLLGAAVIGFGGGLISRRDMLLKRYLPHLSYFVLLLCSGIIFMLLKRMEANQDFRFCFPLCIPFAIVYGYVMESAGQWRCYLKWAYGFLAALFMVVGMIFYLSQYLW